MALLCVLALTAMIDPARAQTRDDALTELRRLANNKQFDTYQSIATLIGPEHALADYPRFWRLAALLEERTQSGDMAALDSELAAFIDVRPGQVLADRLLGPWLRSLGRRGLWRLFDHYWAQWQTRNSDSVWCLAGVSRVLRGLPPGDQVMRVWQQRLELGEDCELLSRHLVDAKQIDTAGLERRLRNALERKSTDTLMSIGQLLGLHVDALESAIASPARALAFSTDPRISLISIGLLARPSPAQAAARLQERQDLTAADRQLLWAIIGASAARDLEPQAWQWAQRGLDADIGTDTREWLVRAAMLAGDWAGAIRAIDRLGARTQASPRWQYWLARALSETGQSAAARPLLERAAGIDDFYGLLAADTLGQPRTIPASAPIGDRTARMQTLRQHAGIDRALKLYRLDMRADAYPEWRAVLLGLDDADLLAAAALACEASVLDQCVASAMRTRTEHDWSLRFLRPFDAPLNASTSAHQLDLAWVYGLIRQESRFLIDARSGVGAKGLMQIMPATGRWIARQRGMPGFSASELDDLAINLDFGAWYLRNVLDQLDGSLVLATAGYNAGPRRPLAWRARMPRPVDGALFAELIPFNETRRYVQNVLSNTAMYGALMRGQPAQIRPLLGTINPSPAPPAAPEPPSPTGEALLM